MNTPERRQYMHGIYTLSLQKRHWQMAIKHRRHTATTTITIIIIMDRSSLCNSQAIKALYNLQPRTDFLSFLYLRRKHIRNCMNFLHLSVKVQAFSRHSLPNRSMGNKISVQHQGVGLKRPHSFYIEFWNRIPWVTISVYAEEKEDQIIIGAF